MKIKAFHHLLIFNFNSLNTTPHACHALLLSESRRYPPPLDYAFNLATRNTAAWSISPLDESADSSIDARNKQDPTSPHIPEDQQQDRFSLFIISIRRLMRTTSPKADKTSMKHLFARVSSDKCRIFSDTLFGRSLAAPCLICAFISLNTPWRVLMTCRPDCNYRRWVD